MTIYKASLADITNVLKGGSPPAKKQGGRKRKENPAEAPPETATAAQPEATTEPETPQQRRNRLARERRQAKKSVSAEPVPEPVTEPVPEPPVPEPPVVESTVEQPVVDVEQPKKKKQRTERSNGAPPKWFVDSYNNIIKHVLDYKVATETNAQLVPTVAAAAQQKWDEQKNEVAPLDDKLFSEMFGRAFGRSNRKPARKLL
ncbi:hypothetical protein SpCBS45565_g08393 [Spizellomyces sp. 'palustris']|nr:hypothetical protein SpCBS45565_g08393 [Spizellomyces sp. 'palustris']